MADTASPPKQPDIVLRVALLLGDNDLRELSPSIWRRFRCNSKINLDVFQDKILQPVMGWTRNYHAYYIKSSDDKLYMQTQMHAADAMMHFRALEGEQLDATDFSVGDVFHTQGEICFYAYDLGDFWYHRIEVEKVISEDDEEWNGKCIVLDGAMRCPDEDGEGGFRYQDKILDLYAARHDPNRRRNYVSIARQLAANCFDRVNHMNVGGVFDPGVFSTQKTQDALEEALRTRYSFRMGSIGISLEPIGPPMRSPAMTQPLQPGQQRVKRELQDTRGEQGNDFSEPFFCKVFEIVNTKPDKENLALCNTCGSPYSLKLCSGCHSVHYCGRSCQTLGWKVHKSKCKQDKRNLEAYHQQMKGEAEVPNVITPGYRRYLKKYNPQNMRYAKGTKVECQIGDGVFVKGHVLQVLHKFEGWTHAYQVQVDREGAAMMGRPHRDAQIWADWDCDYMIRAI